VTSLLRNSNLSIFSRRRIYQISPDVQASLIARTGTTGCSITPSCSIETGAGLPIPGVHGVTVRVWTAASAASDGMIWSDRIGVHEFIGKSFFTGRDCLGANLNIWSAREV